MKSIFIYLENRLFCQSNPQFAPKKSNQESRFWTFTGNQHRLDFIYFLVLWLLIEIVLLTIKHLKYKKHYYKNSTKLHYSMLELKKRIICVIYVAKLFKFHKKNSLLGHSSQRFPSHSRTHPWLWAVRAETWCVGLIWTLQQQYPNLPSPQCHFLFCPQIFLLPEQLLDIYKSLQHPALFLYKYIKKIWISFKKHVFRYRKKKVTKNGRIRSRIWGLFFCLSRESKLWV